MDEMGREKSEVPRLGELGWRRGRGVEKKRKEGGVDGGRDEERKSGGNGSRGGGRVEEGARVFGGVCGGL